jgi:hypothetical protein
MSKHTRKIVALLGLGALGMVACNVAELGDGIDEVDGERSSSAFGRYCRYYRVGPCEETGKFDPATGWPVWRYAVDKLCWNEETGDACYKRGDQFREEAYVDRLTCRYEAQSAGAYTPYWSWDTQSWKIEECSVGSTWFADDNPYASHHGPSGAFTSCLPCFSIGEGGVCVSNTAVFCENGCRQEVACPPNRPCRRQNGRAQCVDANGPSGNSGSSPTPPNNPSNVGSVGGPCFSDGGHEGTCKPVSQCHGKVWILDDKCDGGNDIKCCVVFP